MSEELRNFLFTSESVTEGHPDKIADQISDAVLDEVMRQDPKGRVACETLVTTGLAVVAGEITTTAHVDYDSLVRETIRGVGYDDATYGYDGYTCAVMCTVKRQSPDIAMGVDTHPTRPPPHAAPLRSSQVQESQFPSPRWKVPSHHRISQRPPLARGHRSDLNAAR